MKRKKTFFGLAATLAFLVLSSPVVGEGLSLDSVLSDALENSPRYRELLATVAEKRQAAGITDTLPNPELDGEIRAITGSRNGSDNEYEITLSQPLKLSYLGLRSSVSELLEQSATIEERNSLLELTQSIKLVFAKVWAEQEKERQLSDARERAQTIYRSVELSAKQGAIARGEHKLIQAELERVEAELGGIQADLSRSRAELIRLSGSAIGDAKLKRPLLAALPDRENVLKSFDQSRLPLQKRLDLLAKVAEKQADLARRDSYPGFAPRIGFEHTEDGDDRIIGGISIELPLFDRNQGERIKMNAASNAARSWARYAKSGALREELASLLTAIHASAEQAKKYEDRVVPLLRESLTAYTEQLRAGQGVVFQIWETQRELTEASDRSLELWLKVLAMRSELSILIGDEI